MQSYGLPCIVPDQCAASEKVIDGINGYVFKTGDLQSLKAALLKMEESNIVELQKAIDITQIKKENSLEWHCENLVNCYNQILIGNDSE